MSRKGKEKASSELDVPSSSKSSSRRSKVTEAGDTSSKVDTRLKAKKGNFKKVKCPAKKLITTEEQAEGVKLRRRRNFNKHKDTTCKRRGALKNVPENPPDKFPSLNTRTTTSSLHDALRQLNDAQKAAIHEIGFGSILSLQVKKLPCRLAYWILDKFDEQRCELELDGGSRVKITEDDVYRVYGFPKGNETIQIFERACDNELCHEWASFFGVATREKIKIGLVLSEMLNCTNGGTWFKRHFMIAMAHSLIQSCTSGTVHPYILRCLQDVRTLKRWNWGEYVLSSLVDHKISWVGDEDKVFAGPTLFLVLFYVDRCELHRKKVKREFPVIKNWTSADLRRRQGIEENLKKFGTGLWREPIVLPAEYSSTGENEQTNPNVSVPGADARENDERLGSRIMKKAVFIGEHLEDLRDLIYSASVVDKESQFYVDSVNAACKITGLTVDLDGPRPWRRPRGMEIDDDPFAYSEELHASVDAACHKVQIEKKRDRISTEDMPNFDLHMDSDKEVATDEDDGYEEVQIEPLPPYEKVRDRESTEEIPTLHIHMETGNEIEYGVQQEKSKETDRPDDSVEPETEDGELGKTVDGIEQPSNDATEQATVGKDSVDAGQGNSGCDTNEVVAGKAKVGKAKEVAKSPPRRSTRARGAPSIDQQMEVLKRTYVRKNRKK